MKNKKYKMKIVLERPTCCVGNAPLKNAFMSSDPNFILATTLARVGLQLVAPNAQRR